MEGVDESSALSRLLKPGVMCYATSLYSQNARNSREANLSMDIPQMTL
jgi:hypothetical protein